MSGQTVTCRHGSSQQGCSKRDAAKLVACREQLFGSHHAQYKQKNGLLKITYRAVSFSSGEKATQENASSVITSIQDPGLEPLQHGRGW